MRIEVEGLGGIKRLIASRIRQRRFLEQFADEIREEWKAAAAEELSPAATAAYHYALDSENIEVDDSAAGFSISMKRGVGTMIEEGAPSFDMAEGALRGGDMASPTKYRKSDGVPYRVMPITSAYATSAPTLYYAPYPNQSPPSIVAFRTVVQGKPWMHGAMQPRRFRAKVRDKIGEIFERVFARYKDG